ncbi:MAG TPA: DNA repair protein RadC [Vicinamibacterales bacterium]|nr:DNA repair protein RadC [Vicinamibacterales bacterium]
MRDLAPHDRPREKLLRLGAEALGDNELLAVVLASGFSRAGALAVANAVLQACGGLHGLVRLTGGDLRRVTGVGAARAAQVLAAVELGRRTLVRAGVARLQITCPRDAAVYLMPQFGARAVEHFGVVLLDTKHRVLRTTVVSVGTLDASLVHPREVFREAVAGSAAGLLLFHNHPSGDPAPSTDDEELTRRLVMAGRLLGIDVIDHLILADTRYCSFQETGRL